MTGEHWKDEPDDKDYPAAESYLSLLVGSSSAAKSPRLCAKRMRSGTSQPRTSCGRLDCRCCLAITLKLLPIWRR